MWHGKGHPPTWVEIRSVAEDAIDDSLRTQSLEQLIDTVRGPCRKAGIKAGRNKRDKNAQLKNDYYNLVMGMLQGESISMSRRGAIVTADCWSIAMLDKQAQAEETHVMDAAVQEALQRGIPVTCRRSCSCDDVVVKADAGDAAEAGHVTECLTQPQERDTVEGLINFSRISRSKLTDCSQG
jgi:hypothetical protein